MDDGERDLQEQVEELASTVEQLQAELDRRPRRPPLLPPPPTSAELRRFTSEVAIPGLVLLLETNVRALKLLQRTLRMADERGGTDAESAATQAADVGATALARLEDALAQAQDALEGQPANDEASELLSRARDLRADIESRLEDRSERPPDAESEIPVEEADGPAEPPGPEVNVEAELQSIKDQVDDGEDRSDGTDADGENGAADDGDDRT